MIKEKMRIASMTIFCSEWFRLDNWIKYYDRYKNDLYLHVIINNGKEEDTIILKEKFPDSIVLYSSSRNMLSSYNLAQKYILEQTEANAILQITNDVDLSDGCLKVLYEKLYSSDEIGMVSSIFLKEDDIHVDFYYHSINYRNMDFEEHCCGELISNIKVDDVLGDGLPGGLILGKRSTYERIGFQDEKLFMYSDELDMGLKVVKAGLKTLTTKEVFAWHRHVFAPGHSTRKPYAFYFIPRNHIYIAKKYYGKKVVVRTTMHHFWRAIKSLVHSSVIKRDRTAISNSFYILRGVYAGITNYMNNEIVFELDK